MISFQVDGANVSVGVQESDLDLRLFRAYFYRKFAKLRDDLTGRVGTTIQFSQQFEPNAIPAGITDVQAIPIRDPLLQQRTVTLLTYGDGREWSSEIVQRGQAQVREDIREGLVDSIARSINFAAGTAMQGANCIYTPTGALAAETTNVNYDGTVPAGTYSRHVTVWDIFRLRHVAQILGMKHHPKFGWNLVLEPTEQEPFMRSTQAMATTGPPKMLEKVLEEWEEGTYAASLMGFSVWNDNSLDVLDSAIVGSGVAPTPFGEGLFFGRSPLVEACVSNEVKYHTSSSRDGRTHQLYGYETGVGWTPRVNTPGVLLVPPVTPSSQCIIRIFGT